MEINVSTKDSVNEDEIIGIYKANEWSSAEKPKELLAALNNSHSLVTARINGELVGICNAISDGYLVVYYPHMLVHPDYHGKGIGRKMMEAMQSIYGSFHQQMLTADGDAVKFYKALGFERAGRTEPMWVYAGSDH
ncbi:N-acetyltransferase [Alginatibacterium sediminis]|uniref:N-acetyltransferase n=1 Tax=Alginatibacterium sediminis TaxID=2164068 RepID=A0A420E9E7_9ALTE|nr:GNAT family N-acetyltransferase [Alginatibacterium sediminis]RKF15934.1 N-acetyltransferase [Alginatibacterium sediminis]